MKKVVTLAPDHFFHVPRYRLCRFRLWELLSVGQRQFDRRSMATHGPESSLPNRRSPIVPPLQRAVATA